MILVENLVKSFGALRVLDGLDVAVEEGEVLAVLGPSGCGKSTLLRILAGFEGPDSGVVKIGGETVDGPSPSRGMVDQSSTLFPWLTLRENVAWGPKAAGRGAEALAVADRLIADTGLAGFEDARPEALSGGMRQRGAFAQVLANRPPVLLLDEPFGALDAQTRVAMHEWLRGLLAESPTTVLLVTHDIDEALLLADRLVLIGARPAQVLDRLAVNLGEGRGRSTLTTPEFTALKARVLERLLPA